MTWCDEILGLSERDWRDNPRECVKRAGDIARALTLADLRRAWAEWAHCRPSVQTQGIWFFGTYFSGLAVNDPHRACDFILTMVADEADDELCALIGDGMMLSHLLHHHGDVAQGKLELVASHSARLRWLLGSAGWWVKNAALLPLADRDAWQQWERTHRNSVGNIDTASLDELADLWIANAGRSPIEKERDDLWLAIMNNDQDLVSKDRARGLDLIRRILDKTSDHWVLGMLSAGLLEDIIQQEDEEISAQIEEEELEDPRFRNLLYGVYYAASSDTLRRRFDKWR